jgi:spore maturation protein CgeB
VTPVQAGIPVRVFGPDWRGWIPASAIAGTGVANRDLPPLYERAAVVLNDHWPSMQREGFIANRPYDVVAAGGRVISDHVQGLEDVFGGAVVTYRTTDELLALLRGDLDAIFPSPDRLAGISRTIRERDSFEARARTLLDDVIGALG